MHELSICQGLIEQVEGFVREHGANRVELIVLSVGPLSGIEPELLKRAFTVARMETVAEQAELEIETPHLSLGMKTPEAVHKKACREMQQAQSKTVNIF